MIARILKLSSLHGGTVLYLPGNDEPTQKQNILVEKIVGAVGRLLFYGRIFSTSQRAWCDTLMSASLPCQIAVKM